ncbi:MAG: hypothetical protein B6I18_00530 [Bacteroidetes bacterium 4572_112]|nr:MAG: hypothetical protein B6I18_00530 [Bacteroidetes bacterium 4572_112]
MENLNENSNVPVMSTKDWVITFLISGIPIVGIVMIFIWAFGDNTNPNKANWAKATLVMVLIVIALYILIFAVFGATIIGAASSGAY